MHTSVSTPPPLPPAPYPLPQIAGYKVPKGTIVSVSPFVTCLQSRNYSNPTMFQPERWMQAAAESAKAADVSVTADTARPRDQAPSEQGPAAEDSAGDSGSGGSGINDHFAFSVGPRDCVGQQLALLELQMVVATLAGRFEWEGDALGVELREHITYHVTLQPKGGSLCLRATPRVPAA